jgi:transposase InsO family protein
MTQLALKRALHVPSFGLTLISVQQIAKAGYKSIFLGNKCIIRDPKGKRMIEAKQKKGLHHMACTPLSQDPHALFAMDINHLHKISGHTNFQLLQNSVSKGRLGEITSLTGIPKFCEACVIGKMKKLPFSKSQTKARGPLDIVSSDVGGPVTPEAPGGFRYWVVIVDHYSSNVWVLFAKKKSEVYSCIKQWRREIEAHFRAQIANWEFCEGWIQFFRTDGGGEFTSKEMEAEFKRLGIIHEVTAPYTPEQDGVAERMNQTLVTRATTMLIDSRLPRKFWKLALLAAAYTINRTPTSSQGYRIPHEILYDRPANINHLHRFGCRAYPLIPKEKRHKQKFGNKANRCVFIGYHEGSKAYDLLVINEDGTYGKIITSRHVRFNYNEPSSTMVQPPLEPEATSQEQFERVSQSLLPRATSYYDEDEDTDISLQPNPGSVGAPTVSVAPPRDSPPQADPLPLPDVPSVAHPSERGNPPLQKVAGVRIEPSRRSTRTSVPAQHPSAEYE